MYRARAAIAVVIAVLILAASAELAQPGGHQQPAVPPATDGQDASAMATERLPSVAAHHLPAASWAPTPLPWVGSGPGADGTTTNSHGHLVMQASSSLHPVLPQRLDDRNEPWSRGHCVVDVLDLNSGSHGYNDWSDRVKKAVGACWGTYKESEAWEKLSIAKMQLQEVLDIVNVLLRSATGKCKVAQAPATKRTAGVKSPDTNGQDASAMAGERLPLVAAHHLPTASWAPAPLPWVGSRPGADGTTTNSHGHLAMQASSSLPTVLLQLLEDYHNEPCPCWFRSHYVVDVFDMSSGSHGYNDMLDRVIKKVAEKEEACWGIGKEFKAWEKSSMQQQEAFDIVNALLRPTTGKCKVAQAPATKRAAGVKSPDTDSCNTNNRLEPHAMKGGRKILPDSVNGATTKTQGTKMDGSTKLKGAARKMVAA